MKPRVIKKIIVHCSDSPDDRVTVDAAEIDRWHRERGFAKIGYHYVIKRDGTLEAGRREAEIGAHVAGHNSDSIGICMVGRTVFEPAQYDTLSRNLSFLMLKYRLTASDIYGHKDFDKGKTCPNIPTDKLRTLALKQVMDAEHAAKMALT